MTEHYIDSHSKSCTEHSSTGGPFDSFCKNNPERFLFFVGTKFFLVTYHSCLDSYDKYEFRKMIVEACIEKHKVFQLYEVNRGVDVEKDLKDFRIRNQALRKTIEQVNFIYYNNARKPYAITTKTNYIDSICNQEEIDTNYQEARLFLETQKYLWLLDDLENLRSSNNLRGYRFADYHKTIDHLIQSINKIVSP